MGTNIAPELERQILGLYPIGNSYSDIRNHFGQMYGVDYSESFLSGITDRVLEEILSWKNRPLESVYAIIYLDAVHYKVREDRKVRTKAVYSVLGIDLEGNRDVPCTDIGASEGARHRARVLERLSERGVQDVLFFCVDGLNGFGQAIEEVFPRSMVQGCIVHMVRTSLKFLNWKDYKGVSKDLRSVYTQDTAEDGLGQLERFDRVRGEKYPGIKKKRDDNWAEPSPFFDYSEPIRRMIYTTNAVEALHRCLRKTTKTKGAFTNSQALEKQLYPTLRYNTKRRKRKTRGWKKIAL